MLQDEYPFSVGSRIDLVKVQLKYAFNISDFFEAGEPIFVAQMNLIIEGLQAGKDIDDLKQQVQFLGIEEWNQWINSHTDEQVKEQLRLQHQEREKAYAARKRNMTQDELATLVKKLYKCVHPESTEMDFINGLITQHNIDQTINLSVNQKRRLEEIQEMYAQSLGNG